MNYDCERPTSRVIRPPGGGSSNIFGVPEQAPQVPSAKSTVNPNYQSSVFNDGPQQTSPTKTSVRRDPITGEEIGNNEKKETSNVGDQPASTVVENGKDQNGEPRLGAARNATGIRCAQPPGGRSTVTFG
uniref:Microtubule-associated protein Jupiter n=1 Tax=Phallusia mammillata TaxID=59560 RepID=A0A6F9DET9_9ASCI|nr:HN1-like protein [Phallusia mammillata]